MNPIRLSRTCQRHASLFSIGLPLIASHVSIPAVLRPKSVLGALALYIGGACVSYGADLKDPFVEQPVRTYSTILFTGVDVREQSYYGYVGAIHAFNRNLGLDGFMLRTIGFYNEYDYASAAVAGGHVDAEMTAFDLVLGYQRYFQGFVGRAYVGLDYERHDLSPDNLLDSNRGGDFGVKIRGELETFYASPFHASLLSSYGSAKERYWVRGRAGYNFQGIILGPEVVATGNPETDEQRIGAFATLRDPALVPVEVSASAGYSDTDDNRGGASAYGTFEISVAF